MKDWKKGLSASDLKKYARVQKMAHQAVCIELRDYEGWMQLDAKTAWKILALLPRERLADPPSVLKS
jgi:hypothetical protein